MSASVERFRRDAWSYVIAASLATLFVALLVVSWRRWCDPLADFGRDIYVAWRVSAGDALYRDVAYFNGPFSPHFNALFLCLFGPHVLTLCLVNTALAGMTTGLAYSLLRRVADRLAATLGAVVFLVMFAFAHLLPVGDYGFIGPYSHDATHGVLLSLLGFWLLARARDTGSLWHARLGGLLFGLVLLTKAEIAVAATLGVAGFVWASRQASFPSLARGGYVPLLSGLALPPLGAFGCLAYKIGPREAFVGTLGSWRYLARPGLLTLPNYASSLGLTGAGKALAIAGLWIVFWAVVLVPLLAAALRIPRTVAGRRLVWLVCAVFPIVLVAANLRSLPWLGTFRPLPFALVGLLVWEVLNLRREQSTTSAGPLRVGLLLFALALLARMVAHVTVCHYGFVLAFPGTVLFFAALLTWIPRKLDSAGNYGTALRAGAAGLILALVVVHLAISLRWYTTKTFRLGHGADAILVGNKRPILAAALDQIERTVERGGTLLALPGGAMLNVLSHRASPTPYVALYPPELSMFGEETILAALQRHPPTAVALLTRPTTEYGFQRLGVGYGNAIMSWLAPRYSPIVLIGDDPRSGLGFGVLLMVPAEVSGRAADGRRVETASLRLSTDAPSDLSGDIGKALTAGADTVMIRSLFACVPKDEPSKLAPEGIEGMVPFKGPLAVQLTQLVGGLRAGMGLAGCATVAELQSKARFIRITAVGLKESHAHDVVITKEAPNYRVEP